MQGSPKLGGVKMKVLITGITGFVGPHLAEHSLERGHSIFGTFRLHSQPEELPRVLLRTKLLECDLKDATSVDDIIAKIQPDVIFHLAAHSYVHSSWNAPAETIINNVIGELNLLEAIRRTHQNPRVLIAGSSEEYGKVPGPEQIDEDCPLNPLSPYAVSKVAQDLLGYQYHKSYGLNIIRTRAFNHTGPGRGVVFVCSNFAKQIVLIETGLKPPAIDVGNLEAVRDFTDVRDMVKAYWLAIEKCTPGEVYNICSGVGISIQTIVNSFDCLTETPFEVKQDPYRMRPSDVPTLIGNCGKFVELTKWRREIPFGKTLEDLLNYWRERV